MRRYLPYVGFALLIAVGAATTSAGEFWENLKLGTSRNNSWPDPFLCKDREFVNQPLELTAANGWKRQCLLQGFHFDEYSRLTQAGSRKLNWILTQAPVQRRAVYVQRGPNSEITALRMDSATQMAHRLATTTHVPAIMETDMVDEGWPAAEVDQVTAKYRSTQPDPRLKAASDASSSSGS